MQFNCIIYGRFNFLKYMHVVTQFYFTTEKLAYNVVRCNEVQCLFIYLENGVFNIKK
jgi:hypothetical protein